MVVSEKKVGKNSFPSFAHSMSNLFSLIAIKLLGKFENRCLKSLFHIMAQAVFYIYLTSKTFISMSSIAFLAGVANKCVSNLTKSGEILKSGLMKNFCS